MSGRAGKHVSRRDAPVLSADGARIARLRPAAQPTESGLANGRSEGERAILETVSDGLLCVDRDWRITYVNRAAELIGGKRRADLLGKNLWQAFPFAEDSFRPHYERALAEQVPVEFEELYAPLDLWLHVRAYPSRTG